jgi:methyl-accepting chemotaxis protein
LYGLENVQSTFVWVGEAYVTAQKIEQVSDQVGEPLQELRQLSLLLVTIPDAKGRATVSQSLQAQIKSLDQSLKDFGTGREQDEFYQQLYTLWLNYKQLVNYTHDQVLAGYREAAFINVSGAEQIQFERLSKQFIQWRALNVKNAELVYESAHANYKNTLATALGFIFLVAVGLSLFALYIAKPLVNSLNFIVNLANQIANGNLKNTIPTDESHSEVNLLLTAFSTMQTQLRQRMENDKRISEEALRINSALDNVSTAVIIADNQSNLIYVNRAAQLLFSEEEARIHQDPYFQKFSGRNMLGKTIDIFYKDPTKQRELEVKLTKSHRFNLTMGTLVLDATITPVVNAQSERLGTVGEFKNITEQVGIEHEINSVVHSASQGDFVQRIALNNKDDFFRTVSEGLNQIIEFNQNAVKDTMRMFSALSQGDLTQQITGEYRGAFEQLKNDANNTVLRLTDAMDSIRQGAHAVNQIAEQIASSSISLSQRTEQQAAALEQTAASMEQMTSTVQQNSDNTRQATQLALKAREHAEQGGEVVNNAVHAMNAINESSRQITDIISVIDEIAFQTNLLALNAAVEAARAGEQGRGFAVVASEVRNLAQRSAAAAKEIKQLIRNSVEKVGDGTRLVNQSGDMLTQIMLSVKKVSDIIADISSAGQEQSSGIHQVNKAISQMDEMTQQNAALVQALTALSESMNHQAKMLSEQVAFFKLMNAAKAHSNIKENKSVMTSAKSSSMIKTSPLKKTMVKPQDDDGDWQDF